MKSRECEKIHKKEILHCRDCEELMRRGVTTRLGRTASRNTTARTNRVLYVFKFVAGSRSVDRLSDESAGGTLRQDARVDSCFGKINDSEALSRWNDVSPSVIIIV